MYIKLTRLDNSPIWINASFIVTIEPRKGGGSIVVPIGDGLDYDVKENVDRVLALLDGAPVAPVVPVPAPKLLAKKPYYAANPPQPAAEQPKPVPPQPAQHKSSPAKSEVPPQTATPPAAEAEAPVPAPQDSASAEVATDVPDVVGQPASESPAEQPEVSDAEPPPETLLVEVEESGKKKPARSRTKTAAKKPRTTRSRTKKPALDLSEEQVERLVKMAPGSIRKLQNTLVTQFKVVDAEATVKALEAHGVLAVDRDHIVWSAKAEAETSTSPAESQG